MQGPRRDSRKTDGVIAGYRGRFAPSPSGPLHFGSLVAAVGSFLEARSRQGAWLVRIDDVDAPRTVEGASDDILRTLEGMMLWWDETVLYQSRRSSRYAEALEFLRQRGAAFDCACTRKEVGGSIYPGTCRTGILPGRSARSVRVIAERGRVEIADRIQGRFNQDLARDVGDFIVFRGDGQTGYHLATVVDDAEQGITDVVRGADLLDSTPRQVCLQRLLGVAIPDYAHLPVAANQAGQKLSKQNHAPALDERRRGDDLFRVLEFLGQRPPTELRAETLATLWAWALPNWDIHKVPPCPSRAAAARRLS